VTATPSKIRVFDPFDLPDWTGTQPVTWRSDETVTERPRVRGTLRAAADPELVQQLDLLAVDAAYPHQVAPDHIRRETHQAWFLGEALLVEIDSRVAVAAPGSNFDANDACELLRRFARAVGAPPHQVTVSIVL
jgi:hypothetical protein